MRIHDSRRTVKFDPSARLWLLVVVALGFEWALTMSGCVEPSKADRGSTDDEEAETASSSKKSKSSKKKKAQEDEGEESEADEDDRSKKKKAKKKPKKKAAEADEDETDSDSAEPVAKDDEFAPPPLAAGQWIRFRQVDGFERRTFEYRVVAESGSVKTVEIDSDGPSGKSLIELVIDVQDASRVEGLDVRSARTKTATGIVTVPPSGVQAGMLYMVKVLVLPKPPSIPRESVTVEAGTFERCFTHDHEDTFLGSKIVEKRFVHSSVPINGLVKAEGTSGTTQKSKRTTELLAFGTTGAEAKFPK